MNLKLYLILLSICVVIKLPFEITKCSSTKKSYLSFLEENEMR